MSPLTAAARPQFTMVDESRSKVMFFVWLHSALVQEPPREMCGTARQLTEPECDAEGLPPGARSLTLCKHEIDRAAKDTRCAHFDPDFRLELFLTPLPGQGGPGPALEAARVAAAAAGAEASEPPLRADRDAYRRYAALVAAAGRAPAECEAWLLGADPDAEQRLVGNPNRPQSFARALPVEPGRPLNGRASCASPQNSGSGSVDDAIGGAAVAGAPWDAGRDRSDWGQDRFKTEARLEVGGEEVARGEQRPSRGETLPLMPTDADGLGLRWSAGS